MWTNVLSRFVELLGILKLGVLDGIKNVCILHLQGKSTPLNAYFRVSRNTIAAVQGNKDLESSEVEAEYWKLVRNRDKNLCVYSGSIDCADVGWGFPLPKSSQPQTKHPWNLKVLANSSASVLKSMGAVMGEKILSNIFFT